jgi:hypothetical protein
MLIKIKKNCAGPSCLGREQRAAVLRARRYLAHACGVADPTWAQHCSMLRFEFLTLAF